MSWLLNSNEVIMSMLLNRDIPLPKGVSTGEVSDGFHTFNELYEFRKLYNALLFNLWYSRGEFFVHKSKRNYDGELCFGGGWFVVMAILPGGQITNHYKLEDWDLFKVSETERAIVEYDGHTSKDVLDRLREIC